MERGVSLKKILAVLAMVFMLGLTGCVHMVEITDEESETIARTAAWLLFKYDNNYKENLITPTPTVTPTPVQATPTPVPDEIVEPTKAPDASEGNVQEIDLPEFNASVDETLGISDLHLEYDGYELYDSYTFEALSIEPKKADHCLMLVFLKLQNVGDEAVAANILEMQPKCRLYADVTEQLSPMRTVLLNDFQYLVMDIPAGESYSSVLVFEVERDFNPESLDLYLTIGESTAHMNLQ